MRSTADGLFSRARPVGAAAVLLLIAGCASGGGYATSTAGAGSPEAAGGALMSAALDEYTLGPGDKVRVIVYMEPDLSGEFAVDPKGDISFPLLGDIRAAGKTAQELRAHVTERLSEGYLNDARVAAEVVAYRPYYIMGEITTPGEYPYGAEMSVIKAVAAAGGFTYRAKKSTVYIKRVNSAQEEKFRLTPQLMVYPGDIVRVGERFF